MKKMDQKLMAVLLCTLCIAFLCGFRWDPFSKPAQFKDPNVKLVDLGAMVRDSAPGKGGNREASKEGEAEIKDGAEEGDGAGSRPKEAEKELTVTVEDDRIFVNGEKMKDLNALKVRLALEYRNNSRAKLVDDYASWKTYTEVYKALREEGIAPEEERKP